jgi:hypothetical protein
MPVSEKDVFPVVLKAIRDRLHNQNVVPETSFDLLGVGPESREELFIAIRDALADKHIGLDATQSISFRTMGTPGDMQRASLEGAQRDEQERGEGQPLKLVGISPIGFSMTDRLAVHGTAGTDKAAAALPAVSLSPDQLVFVTQIATAAATAAATAVVATIGQGNRPTPAPTPAAAKRTRRGDPKGRR